MFFNLLSKKNLLFPLFSIFIIILWFFFKVIQFQFNIDDYCDGYISLQLSKGWLEGRPFLFDTFFGYHALQHNYYFLPIVGFFTKFLGVYGLFIAYLFLLVILLVQWYKIVKTSNSVNTNFFLISIFIYCFGPMAYYIYMDFLGWHSEQYFLPLLALFTLSFYKRNNFIIVLWMVLAFLVKETSSVLLCCIFLFISITDIALSATANKLVNTFLNKRNLAIIFIFLSLFIASVALINYLNINQSSRLSVAIENFKNTTRRDLIIYTALYFATALITFIIGVIPIYPIIKLSKYRNTIIYAIVGGFIVLFLLFYTESFFFFGKLEFGISYPARIVGLWSFLLCCFIYLVIKNIGSKQIFPMNYLYISLIAQFLFSSILVSHQTNSFFENRNLKENLDRLVDSRFGFRPFPNGTANQLYTLSKKLPNDAEIVAHRNQLNYFMNVYPIDWDLYSINKPLNQPYIYVYDKKLIGKHDQYYFPKSGYKTIQNNDYLILVDSLWHNQL